MTAESAIPIPILTLLRSLTVVNSICCHVVEYEEALTEFRYITFSTWRVSVSGEPPTMMEN